MSPIAVSFGVALIAAIAGVSAAWITSRSSSKVTAQSSASSTLDKAYEQRILFRDEQIVDLTNELAGLRAQVKTLTDEVQRLTALVVKLGGVPHAK